MVIHDDDVGGHRAPTRLHHEAAIETRAGLAETVVYRRGDVWPERRVFGNFPQFGNVALISLARPSRDTGEQYFVFRPQLGLTLSLREAMQAQIVRPPFQQRTGQCTAERATDEGQILKEQLILQRTGGRTDQGAQPGTQRRHQIRKGLAGAGPRLDQQLRARSDRLGHCVGH